MEIEDLTQEELELFDELGLLEDMDLDLLE
jgi:hypothetical protein